LIETAETAMKGELKYSNVLCRRDTDTLSGMKKSLKERNSLIWLHKIYGFVEEWPCSISENRSNLVPSKKIGLAFVFSNFGVDFIR
jgi:hypothetical protein